MRQEELLCNPRKKDLSHPSLRSMIAGLHNPPGITGIALKSTKQDDMSITWRWMYLKDGLENTSKSRWVFCNLLQANCSKIIPCRIYGYLTTTSTIPWSEPPEDLINSASSWAWFKTFHLDYCRKICTLHLKSGLLTAWLIYTQSKYFCTSTN